MKRFEHLLTITAEECTEVGQRASKILRFGPQEIQPGQDLTNVERLLGEWTDLNAMMEMLQEEGVLVLPSAADMRPAIAAKKAKVEKFLRYSAQCGTLDGEVEEAPAC